MPANIREKYKHSADVSVVEFTCESCGQWFLVPTPYNMASQICPNCGSTAWLNDDNIQIKVLGEKTNAKKNMENQ